MSPKLWMNGFIVLGTSSFFYFRRQRANADACTLISHSFFCDIGLPICSICYILNMEGSKAGTDCIPRLSGSGMRRGDELASWLSEGENTRKVRKNMKKIISGKVRDVYEVNDQQLAVVTTDRISAFDVILKSQVEGKGIALNLISNYWFDFTKDIIPNHIVSTDIKDMPEFFSQDAAAYDKRTVLVKKLKMLPYEFVVRGYIFGNMWKAYQNKTAFCGYEIQGDYQLAQKLETPILTPSSKNTEGHDEYIPMDQLYSEIGKEKADAIRDICLKLYQRCYEHAKERGILIADTKFELGYDEDGNLVLADEIFTPDSSRFWDASQYRVGESPKSYDKQFVRDWLIANHLDGVTPAPELPADVLEATSKTYKECYQKITGRDEY